jgi:hypothetical protein
LVEALYYKPEVGSIPDEVILFFSRILALGWTQPVTEMITSNLSGGKGRSARKAGNLTAICEWIV